MSDLKTKTSELESGTKIIRNKMPLTKHHEIGVHCLIMNKILVVDQVACPQLFFPYGILSISPAKIINNKEDIALTQNIAGQNIMVLQCCQPKTGETRVLERRVLWTCWVSLESLLLQLPSSLCFACALLAVPFICQFRRHYFCFVFPVKYVKHLGQRLA